MILNRLSVLERWPIHWVDVDISALPVRDDTQKSTLYAKSKEIETRPSKLRLVSPLA
jgi:hypothetical protein